MTISLRFPELTKESSKLNFDPLPHQTQLSDKLEDESGQLVFHGLGSGKCVRGDTLVYTSEGIKRIDSFWGPRELVGHEETITLPLGLTIQGGWGSVRLLAAYRQRLPSTEQTYRVETRRGNSLEATGRHRFLVAEGCGLKWKPAAKLTAGDVVAMSASPMQVLAPSVTGDWTANEVEFLLWQAFEGHENSKGKPAVQITQKSAKTRAYLMALARSIGLTPHNRSYPPACGFIDFWSVRWQNKLSATGYNWGVRSAAKVIPPFVLSSVQGLELIIQTMLDAEGSVADTTVEFPSASPDLVASLQAALTYKGVRSALHSKRGRATNGAKIYRTYYRVSVMGEDLAVLRESGAAKARLIPDVTHDNPNFGYPAKDVFTRLKEIGLLATLKVCGGTITKDTVSLATLDAICDRLDDLYCNGYHVTAWGGIAAGWAKRTQDALAKHREELPVLRAALIERKAFRWEPIKSVTPGEVGGIVYDLEVDAPDAQACYVAGSAGFITHNTKTIVNAAHEHGLPLVAIVPASLRNNMKKELETSGFKHPSQVLSYEEALKKMKDPEFLEHASNSLVAFDEAHRGGSEIGQRQKLLKHLPSKKKILATATPARNSPSELGPLINSIHPGSLPDNESAFNKKFIETSTKPVGFAGWLTGQKGEKVRRPKNLHEFEHAIKGKVDFYQAADRSQYPTAEENIVDVPMAPKQQAAYEMVMGKYPMLWYKVKHGLPQTKRDEADFKAFMSGPRQVMNHPGPYNTSATDDDAPKIKAAVDEIEKRYKKDKNFRGVAYSGYLDTGVNPLSRELERRGIPHAMFTGEQDDTERKHIVESYNKGKLPVMLISGAGAEGLDLKGTKLMQILEPHWNEELVDQVRGRAIRYKSHMHLPPAERHVEVQRFHAVTAPSWFDRLVGRTRGTDQSADEYLYNKAQDKRQTLKPFLDILKGRTADDVEAELAQKHAEESSPAVIPCDTKWNTPGVLLDLDGTLVRHMGAEGTSWGPTMVGTQQLLPRRLETLRLLKSRGYKLIGVTNRTTQYEDMDMTTLLHMNHETMELCEGLLDDIVCCPEGDERVIKPSPTMLLYAMQKYRLDPDNTIMVGDLVDDERAASNAGVPFTYADAFFSADWAAVPHALPQPAPHVLGSRRWVSDSVGNLVGTLACNGQEAVNALKKRIEQHIVDMANQLGQLAPDVPEMITSDEVLKIKIPEANDDLAAWIDAAYEERDAGSKVAAMASPLPGNPLTSVFRASPHADPFHKTLHEDHAHVTPFPGIATKRYGTKTGPNEFTTNLHELKLNPGVDFRVHEASNVGPDERASGKRFETLRHVESAGDLQHSAHEGLVHRSEVTPGVIHRVRYDSTGNLLAHEPLRPDHPPIVPWAKPRNPTGPTTMIP